MSVEQLRIDAHGDHTYRVQVPLGEDRVTIFVRATPDVVARIAGADVDETRVVAATIAFLTTRQEADDLPEQLDLDDVMAAYDDYVEDVQAQLAAPGNRGRNSVATESAAMQKNSLIALAGELLAAAHKSATGRSTHTLYGGHRKALRQNLIALTAGTALPDQDSRGETILQVLQGHVRLTGNSRCDCTIGDHIVVPRTPQCLEAIDDSVVLVTVAKQSSNA